MGAVVSQITSLTIYYSTVFSRLRSKKTSKLRVTGLCAGNSPVSVSCQCHDDVIKWKHFPRYWPFVWGIYRSPVNSPHRGQWRGALMFSFICDWINGWVNNREAGDLRRHLAHYDVTLIVMYTYVIKWMNTWIYMYIHLRLYSNMYMYRYVKNPQTVGNAGLCELSTVATDACPQGWLNINCIGPVSYRDVSAVGNSMNKQNHIL